MARAKTLVALAALSTFLSLTAGCSMLSALSSGNGTIPAECTLPAKARVLVFVDPRETAQMTPDQQLDVADAIVKHLYKYKAADNFVSQQQVVVLRSKYSDDDFRRIGVAAVARLTDADVVIHVDVTAYALPQMSENQMAIGYARTLIKVVNRDGKRMFPDVTSTLGKEVDAEANFQLNDPGSPSPADQKLNDILALRIGRIFHEYDSDDRQMTK